MAWSFVAPHDTTVGGEPFSFDLAGQYLFVAYTGDATTSPLGFHDGHVEVYTQSSDAEVGYMEPSANVSVLGWLDAIRACHAYLRANGEYDVVLEEDVQGKNLLYRWMPK